MSRMGDVIFSNDTYINFKIPDGALVYCDIPYRDTTGYSHHFSHDDFYRWASNIKNATVIISEYQHNVPDNGHVLWRKESKKDIRDRNGKQISTVEVLFTIGQP